MADTSEAQHDAGVSPNDATQAVPEVKCSSVLASSLPIRAETKLNDELWDRIDDVITHLASGPGKQLQLSKYLIERAEVEENYVKALNAHNRKFESTEFGTMGQGWGLMKASIEQMSSLHSSLADWCRACSVSLQTTAKNTADAVKEIKAENDRVNKELSSANDQNNSANRLYEKLCKECETAIFSREKIFDTRAAPVSVSNMCKLAEQSVAAYLKAQDANKKYHSTAEFLLNVHSKDDDIKRTKLDELQHLEECRFSQQRDTLYDFGKQHRIMAARLVEIMDQLDSDLSVVSIHTDIADFAKAHSSGEKPKGHVTYTPYLAEGRIDWDVFNPLEPNLKNGMVEKQGKGLIKKWQPRFFVVKDGFLYYFKSETGGPTLDILRTCSLQGTFCLKDMVHEEAADLHSKDQFYLRSYPKASPKEVRVYRTHSHADMLEWVAALEEAGKFQHVSHASVVDATSIGSPGRVVGASAGVSEGAELSSSSPVEEQQQPPPQVPTGEPPAFDNQTHKTQSSAGADEWEEVVDDHGRTYYHHPTTGHTAWVKPEGGAPVPPPAPPPMTPAPIEPPPPPPTS